MCDELKPLIAKNDEPPMVITPGTGDWDAAMRAVKELEEYDFDARRKQHECDFQHANDHLA